jgi:hypothetical protein
MTHAPDAEAVAAVQLSAFTGWADIPPASAPTIGADGEEQAATAADDSDSALRPIIVYNSLLQQRNVLLIIRTTPPASQSSSSSSQSSSSPSPPPTGSFTNARGDPIPCEAIPCSSTPACPSPTGFLLHAQVDVPALGFTTVFINGSGSCDLLQPQNASWIEYLSTRSHVVAVAQVGGDNGTHVLHSIQRPSGDTLLPSLSLKSLTSNGDGA